MTTPGMRKKRTLEITDAIALIKCLSQPVKRTTIANPMTEHTAWIRPLFVMLLAKAFKGDIGAPPIHAIRIPAPIKVTRASYPLINA